MKIYLFNNFSKRENSTKRPASLLAGDEYDCVLKEPTSAISPVVMIDQGGNNAFKNYGYAYIPAFYRYYWIDDIVSDGPFWTYTLKTDVLATYKAQIGANTLYMVRSSDSFSTYIPDNYYPATGEHEVVRASANTPWLHTANNENIAISDGVFVLGVVAIPYSTGAGSYGSIRYYAVKYDEMYDLIDDLLTNTITTTHGFDFDEASEALQKSLINPLSYIKSCMWLPILYNSIDGVEMTSLKIWEWDISASAKLITENPPYLLYATNIDITAHPQASRGKYLNLTPYTSLTLQYPPFGLLPLDTSLLIDSTTVRCQVLIDLITGTATLDIMAADSNGVTTNIQRTKSQVGVDIQLTEVSYDYSNMVLNGVGIGAEAVNSWLGNLLPSGISNAVSQIGTAANAMRTRVSSLGGNGSFAELRGFAYLYHDFFKVPDEDRSHAGRPLCANVRPDTGNSGTFYIALHGDIELPNATTVEHDNVKTYLESGFFYE